MLAKLAGQPPDPPGPADSPQILPDCPDNFKGAKKCPRCGHLGNLWHDFRSHDQRFQKKPTRQCKACRAVSVILPLFLLINQSHKTQKSRRNQRTTLQRQRGSGPQQVPLPIYVSPNERGTEEHHGSEERPAVISSSPIRPLNFTQSRAATLPQDMPGAFLLRGQHSQDSDTTQEARREWNQLQRDMRASIRAGERPHQLPTISEIKQRILKERGVGGAPGGTQNEESLQPWFTCSICSIPRGIQDRPANFDIQHPVCKYCFNLTVDDNLATEYRWCVFGSHRV